MFQYTQNGSNHSISKLKNKESAGTGSSIGQYLEFRKWRKNKWVQCNLSLCGCEREI